MKYKVVEKGPDRPLGDTRSPMEISLDSAEFRGAPSLDIHGMTKDEAIGLVDQFIDSHFKQGTEAVEIIHGKGMGILQNAVDAYLKSKMNEKNEHRRMVAGFRGNRLNIGGSTVVALNRATK